MKLIEAWRLSRMPYTEVVYRSLAEERGRMWWGAFGRSHFDKETQGEAELVKRALRIARFDKLIVAVFCVASSVMPFTSLFAGASSLGLTSSISLSLAVTFGFTALYATQTLSSFVSAESSALLSTLPLSREDFSRVTLFSFVRSVDYMVVGSVLSQTALVAYMTASLPATLLMLVSSIMNAVFAVAVSLWFSRLFYRNLLRGGRSKSGAVLRLVFILMWGSLLLGVGLLLSIPWYIVPQLESALVSLDQVSSLFFSIVYPFSAGIAIGNVVYPSVTFKAALTASVAMMTYAVLVAVAAKWTLGTVKSISQGIGIKTARMVAKDFSIKTRRPLFGYVVKDLRVSSRNPATAIFFALPVLEALFVALLITNFQTLRASTMLVATTTGGILALLMPLALLNAEGAGLEYTKTLPVGATRIMVSKTLISTAAYSAVPLTLLGIAFLKRLTSPFIILIPFFTILAIASACIVEVRLFLGSAAKGRIAALTRDFEKLTAGVTITVIPEVAYAAAFLTSFSHIIAVLALGAVAAAELIVAVFLLKRS